LDQPDVDVAYLSQIKALFKRHPKNTIIWAHAGLGRVVRPVKGHAAIIEAMLKDPDFSHVNIDISWDQVAKYIVETQATGEVAADLMNRYPDRFLFGTDDVAPPNQETYLRVFYDYDPLWKLLSKEANEKIRKENYERIFDEARRRVRAWEKAHLNGANSQ
jgi:predicted TIM-barrel fold metal-dependent hydrolase